MNIPFSKNLAKNYLVPFIPLLVFSQLLFYNDTANLVQSNKQAFAIFAITSIVPIIYANMANNQHIHFKNREKGPQKERLFALPFSGSFASFIFATVTIVFGYGMAQLIQNGVHVSALLTLFTSAILLVLLTIVHEHPKVWFSETFHPQAIFDKVKNTPKTDLPAYQEGVFCYTDHYFMLQKEHIKKSIF